VNWDAIGAIGQIVGAIAVIATLGYLARQIKQQNASTSLNVQNGVLDELSRLNELLASDETLAVLFNKGVFDPDELSDGEAAQFSWMLRFCSNVYIKLHHLRQEGLVSQSDWENQAMQGSFLFNSPGGKKFLEGHTRAFQDEFRAITSTPTGDSAIDFTLGRRNRGDA
jgi:hypothetical protein